MSAVAHPPEPSRAVEFSLLGLLALLWGSSYLLIKLALASVPPLTLIAVRVAVAALLLLAVVRMRGEHLPTDGATWQQTEPGHRDGDRHCASADSYPQRSSAGLVVGSSRSWRQ